jgi:hypothetical protein
MNPRIPSGISIGTTLGAIAMGLSQAAIRILRWTGAASGGTFLSDCAVANEAGEELLRGSYWVEAA